MPDVFYNVSKPYVNPLIRAPGLNPIRRYRAVVMEDGKRREVLTGVVFNDQEIEDRIRHHARLRGYGTIELRKSRSRSRLAPGIRKFERRR